MLQDLSNYYNSPTYSNLTICIDGNELKAHKIVLANSSEYFRVAFDGRFKESSSNVIELQEDDPNTIEGLIAHIYGLPLDEAEYYRKTFMHGDASTDDDDYMKYLVDLHITASKYLAPTTQERIGFTFEAALAEFMYNDGVLVKYVYVTHAGAASELRKPMAASFARMGDNVAETQERVAKQLLLDVPEFAVDLMKALMEQKKEVAEEHGRASKRVREKDEYDRY